MAYITEVQDPPCEVFRCLHYRQCKYNLLSCESFHRYIFQDVVVHPKTIKVSVGKNRGVEYIDHTALPSREWYLKTFVEARA